jgi:hypothetical protein
VVGLTVGLAVLLVATVGVVTWLSPPASPAATGPRTASTARPATTSAPATPTSPATSATAAVPTQQSPRPVPRPSSSPSKPAEPKPPRTGLKSNSLYDIDLSGSGSCKAKVRRPDPPLKNSALAPYLRTIVACLMDTFRAPLARQGFTLRTPKVKTYKGSIKTPCGRVGSSSNPAFYCARTIYWPVASDDGREAYTLARLGYVGLAAHEFGHHLQSTTGMLYEYGVSYADASRSGRLTLSRRLELQAQCFEGVFLAHNRKALGISSQDRREIRQWHSFTGDEDPPSSRQPDHGTSKAQLGWLDKGLDGADFGRCNTWSASKKAVK